MNSPKGSGFNTPERRGSVAGRGGSVAGTVPTSIKKATTASTTKAKHRADRLDLSEELTASLVSEKEDIDALWEAEKKNTHEQVDQSHTERLRAKRDKLIKRKKNLVTEIQDGTKRFVALQESIADCEEENDNYTAEVLKGELKEQQVSLYRLEMNLNVANLHIGAVSAEMQGEGVSFLEDKEFVNFGTMRLSEVQGVFDGSSFASDIKEYVEAVAEKTGETQVQVLSNILKDLKKGRLSDSLEFVDMFGQFSEEAQAVLGRKHRDEEGYSPAIKSNVESLGFSSCADCMLWRTAMYLDLEWDLDHSIPVPAQLSNPFRFKVVKVATNLYERSRFDVLDGEHHI